MIKQKLAIFLLVVAGLLVNDSHAASSPWERWVILNDGREVVQWNYVHNETVNVVIRMKTPAGWLIPIGSMDGPTGAVAWTANLHYLKPRRVRVSEKRMLELDNLRAQYQWIVSSRGEKIFDYGINRKGELVKFPGLLP